MHVILSLLLLTLPYAATSRWAHDAATIVRQHYGVTFKPIETFMPISGHWLHTFGLRIPTRPRILEPRLVNCTSLPRLLNLSASHCIAMKPVVDKFSEIQTHMSHMLVSYRVPYTGPSAAVITYSSYQIMATVHRRCT